MRVFFVVVFFSLISSCLSPRPVTPFSQKFLLKSPFSDFLPDGLTHSELQSCASNLKSSRDIQRTELSVLRMRAGVEALARTEVRAVTTVPLLRTFLYPASSHREVPNPNLILTILR